MVVVYRDKLDGAFYGGIPVIQSQELLVLAKEQEFRLVERDALRFAADRPYRFENMTNSTARLLLIYQYLK